LRRAVLGTCGALLLAATAWAAQAAIRDAPAPASAPAAGPAPPSHLGPLYGIGPFAPSVPPRTQPTAIDQVRTALATAYYRHVSPKLLTLPSIDAIIEELGDPYTEYLTPSENEMLQERLSRRYHGVGLTVSAAEEGLIVTSSLSGPAREAGIRPGDVIVAIDGRQTAAMAFDRAVSLMAGEEGSIVNLVVRRSGSGEAMTFTVARRTVDLPVLNARLVKTGGHKVGHVRLHSLSTTSAARLEAATERLVANGADGLVLDLRGNPGGLLAQAIRVVSLYLESGVVCMTESANQEHREFSVSGAPVETEVPMVVLVDGRTASAAEIVAAALRDNKRAVVVGERTYGKTSVQSLFPLSNGAALRLTTSSYLTPSGKAIGGRGLKPKVRVADDPATRPDEAAVAAAKVLVERLAG
jgi:carboxyl-terminal processing protease